MQSLIQAESNAHEAFLRLSANTQDTYAQALQLQMSLLAGNPDPQQNCDERSTSWLPEVSSPADTSTLSDGAFQRTPWGLRPIYTGPKPAYDRDLCLAFARGTIAAMLGPEFAPIDGHPTRVRLPDEPLMLVDRIVDAGGETMKHGFVITEHDVLHEGWYLDGGFVPACIAIESGQADLWLSAYLGIDFITKGQAVYRLLDAAVTFHRALPKPGETIRYDIKIEHFFKQRDTYLFRFNFTGSIDGEPLLTMRDGCAGFFSQGELAAGKGIVRSRLQEQGLKGKGGEFVGRWVPMARAQYDDAQLDCLRRGDLAGCFGPEFSGLPVVDPFTIPGGKMHLVDRVTELDPAGGRYGIGLIRADLDIHPEDWFLTCHFVDDMVMPGTLMYECCLHTLRIFLLRMGWVGEANQVSAQPVIGVPSRLKCRGQVLQTTQVAGYEVHLKEIGFNPEPYVICDAAMFSDGKHIVDISDMTLRMTGLDQERLAQTWAGRTEPVSTAAPEPVLFSYGQLLAFAQGNPSEAFGARYLPFDSERRMARLPRPPFLMMSRVAHCDSPAWKMKAGGKAVAAYDVQPGDWYFDESGQAMMPFVILLEAALQPCGWMAAFMGSALQAQEDVFFRNLGGEAVKFRDVYPDSGTLTTEVHCQKVSASGGMIIQHYAFSLADAHGVVYEGTTYFGFFTRSALANQVGVTDARWYSPDDAERARRQSCAYPVERPFPQAALRMVDRIDMFISDGGPHGLGLVEGVLPVDPAAWFFEAHFYQDPVMPGSLGLDGFFQLLQFFAAKRWGVRGTTRWALGTSGRPHHWTYRGQIVRENREMRMQALITAVDDENRSLVADGYLATDGKVIYAMQGFTLQQLDELINEDCI